MQVSTVEESRYHAREKYAEYLRAVKERHCEEYEALKNGYRELSRGRQVIDLVDTMKQAGVDHLNRPRLAIVRADARLCWFSWARQRSAVGPPQPLFSANNDLRPTKTQSVSLPFGTFLRPQQLPRCRAVVPSIPPRCMPAGKLSNYHILWEAEWESIPVDPMLLKHLGKNLYVVLAAWDLTPLEQSVLRDTP